MGADLWYMVIGKKEITEEMRQAAIAKFGRLCFAAKALMLRIDEGEDVGGIVLPGEAPDEWDDEFDCNGADFLEQFAMLKDEEIEERVNAAVNFLREPSYRDCASRTISDDEFVLFAGEMTWGDEPEGGGYGVLKDIHMMGIVEELGLR